MFKNRNEAAKILSESLKNPEPEVDRVIATSPSGLRTAKKVSQELDLPLSVLMSVKITAPGSKSPVLGAVSQDGTIWLDDAMIEEFMVERSYIQEIAGQEKEKLREAIREEGLKPAENIKSERILLVTDGVSSGMKTAASLGACMKKGVERRIVATPFISQHAREKISGLADEIRSVREPRFVASVKDGYVSKTDQKTLT